MTVEDAKFIVLGVAADLGEVKAVLRDLDRYTRLDPTLMDRAVLVVRYARELMLD